MKRLIALILVLCTVILSCSMLYSCQYIVGNGSGNNIGENTGDDSGNTGNDSGNSGGNSDNTGNDSGNTGNDSGNTGGNSGNNGDDSGNSNGGNKDEYVPDCAFGNHIDEDNNEYCDLCNEYVIVVIDFYVLNDLHGKFCDTDTQPGVDELATYLKLMEQSDDNVVFRSSGDMWQGTAESNLTGGLIMTEWMNELNFVSMTIGNHEYDWGEDSIRKNLAVAEFPFLAINIYDLETKALADYCTPSIMIERDGIQIGIIGAIGDCYSSISYDMVEGLTFKVGNELTALVKAESDKLRAAGADLIVYSLHDGYGSSNSGRADLIVYSLHDGYGSSNSGTSTVSSSTISSYYDDILSDGYVDLVFEAHSHQRYTLVDSKGVYHLQGGGENYGLSHVEIEVNAGNGDNRVSEAGVIASATYAGLADDPGTEAIEDKYRDIIDYAYAPLGTVSKTYSDSEVEDYVASLYLEKGLEKWGDEYDIVLGGGFLRTRTPYDLTAGTKTYADILSLLPFDNRLVLCSVSGSNLKNRFINTSSSDYHTALSEYGSSILNSISNNKTYYIIVDTYTSLYTPNGLTVVDYYDNTTFARDLLAEAIKSGEFEVKHDTYELTSIPDALKIGESLGNNKATADYYYIKGTVKSAPNSTYGNLYLVDEQGNEIYIYGLYDTEGNRYDSMSTKPVAGDTIVVYSTIYKYYSNSTTIELKNAVVIEIDP